MALNIGLNVIEVDGSAAPAIQGAATSVAAFNVATSRGTPKRPVQVTSFPQFTQRFGGFAADSYGAYLVKGFFDNGGQFAWVNRVAGAGGNAPTPATGTIPAGAQPANQLMSFSAGYRGSPDPRAWSNTLTVGGAPSFSAHVKKGTPVHAGGATLVGLAGL